MAGELSRRGVMGVALGAIFARFLPAMSAAPVAAAVAPTSTAPLLTWIVGTPGEWNHQVIRAPDLKTALWLRAEECEDDGTDPDCCCDACMDGRGLEATRVPAWDGKPEDSITSGDWLRANFGAACSRCGEETDGIDAGHAVGPEAVCECCMTLADWRIIDPDYAAEMEAEALADAVDTPAPSQTRGEGQR